DPPEDPPADRDAADEPDAPPPPPATCEPLPPPEGDIVSVTADRASELSSIVAAAGDGTTIRLETGTYALNGDTLVFNTPGVTLRSASNNPGDVTLDGNYGYGWSGDIMQISASRVTIAHVTIKRAYEHPVHIMGGPGGDIEGILLHNIHVIDPGQQGIKVNRSYEHTYVDRGRIECSLIELTDEGRPHVRDNCYTGGIDAHGAWGWEIRLNTIRGFWCPSGLSEHAIHFWQSSRDTLVERNLIVNCARAIGFGMYDYLEGMRAYDPNPYPDAAYLGHYDGIIRNNMIFADDTVTTYDSGINLHQTRGASAICNTIVTTMTPFNSIEWRWPDTDVYIADNLVSHNIMDRGGSATLEGNIEDAPLSLFEVPADANLHLLPTAASAIDAGVSLAAGLCDEDFDGQSRDANPDVGADEFIEE
ncbi:MAG: hypothetical protein ABIJ56_24215, partial [Pseudomonadota bacterium]